MHSIRMMQKCNEHIVHWLNVMPRHDWSRAISMDLDSCYYLNFEVPTWSKKLIFVAELKPCFDCWSVYDHATSERWSYRRSHVPCWTNWREENGWQSFAYKAQPHARETGKVSWFFINHICCHSLARMLSHITHTSWVLVGLIFFNLW